MRNLTRVDLPYEASYVRNAINVCILDRGGRALHPNVAGRQVRIFIQKPIASVCAITDFDFEIGIMYAQLRYQVSWTRDYLRLEG